MYILDCFINEILVAFTALSRLTKYKELCPCQERCP